MRIRGRWGVAGAVVIFILILFVFRGREEKGKKVEKTKSSRHKGQEEYVDRRGIRVIVGHYKGDEGPGPNLTLEELNSNNLDPEAGAGEGGRPVNLKPREVIRAKRLFHINQFNIVASDKISLDRKLEDQRSAECRLLRYDLTSLPSTSIVIVYHNEAYSTLLRTLHSATNNSPLGLIKEFVLVDDASARSFLGPSLEKDLKSFSVPVNIIRTASRVGLIQARLIGAKAATAPILTFLDAHCECTEGWLQPLLYRVNEDRTAVVCPIIDIINDDTFQYTKSFSLHWGAFNWDLHFRWFSMGPTEMVKRRENSTRPYRTPTMAGGLFSIDREYFWQSGSYDEAMDIWGGENLEMSFRVWQCGGSVEIAPCARVGHVFRKASPYSFPREGGVGAVLHNNLARVAGVWLDEWQGFFNRINPSAQEAAKTQNLTSRKQLRERMGCKNFAWYLDNVWPETFFPRLGQFFGRLKNEANSQCLTSPHRRPGTQSTQPSGPASLDSCTTGVAGGQVFSHSKEGCIMTNESICLDCPQWKEQEPGIRFAACSGIDRQEWFIKDSKVVHRLSSLCLTLSRGATSDSLTLQRCTEEKEQRWMQEEEAWHD